MKLSSVLLTAGLAVGLQPAQAVLAQPGAGHASSAHQPHWTLLDTGTQAHFRGLSAISRKVAWISGYNGLVLRTVDGGRHWIDASPAAAASLQLRDISAFDATHAVAMAAGTGTDSRLFVTANGGRSWTQSYQNTDPAAFFDCMSFFDSRHGLVLSDPVDGKFRILSTRDGGRHWTVLPNAGMPAALAGEAGFAASGQCITTSGSQAWFGAGGASSARIFHSANGGLNWDVRTSPLISSPSAGVFGLAFRGPFGIAVGGDFAAPASPAEVSAVSWFGSPWLRARHEPSGYRSGVSWLPRSPATAIAVGLTGSDISYDAGLDWHTFDTGQFDTVSCPADGSCWASGDLGRVAVLGR